MSFCAEIERETQAQRAAMAFHPFVNGIGDGTLPLDRFRHFITQDYVYLIDFARCLALAAAKAPDLPTMAWFARSVDYILNTEMELHRSYCAQFGITAADLDATRPAPTCYSYTSYLLRVAHQGSFGELVAALLPCIWATGRSASAWPTPAPPTIPATPNGLRCTPARNSRPWPRNAAPSATGWQPRPARRKSPP